MNRDLIDMYKNEFEYWLKGGQILGCKVAYKLKGYAVDWQPIGQDYKWDTDINLVINDKYVEFRKAFEEGKTIQVDVNYWAFPETNIKKYVDLPTDLKNFSWDKYTVDCYRIKPEESKFKVGDWVVTPLGAIIQVLELDTKWGMHNKISKLGLCCTFYLEMCKLWKPEENEWCLFKLADDEAYTLAQFEAGDIYDSESSIKSVQLGQNGSPYWNICIPFIGEIPTIH